MEKVETVTWPPLTLGGAGRKRRRRCAEAGGATLSTRLLGAFSELSVRYDAYEAEYDRGKMKKPLRQAAAAAAAEEAAQSRGWRHKGAARGRGRGRGRGAR